MNTSQAELAKVQEQLRVAVEALVPFQHLEVPQSAPDDATVCLTSLNGGIVYVGKSSQINVGSIRNVVVALQQIAALKPTESPNHD